MDRHMRRTAAIAVLFAIGGPLAGCGGHGASTAGHSDAAHGSGAPGAPHTPGVPSQAQAQAFARAVNLKAADLPGFSVSPEHGHEHETEAEKRLKPELRRCSGSTVEAKAIVEAGSQKFERSAGIASASVSSEVTIAQTATLSAKELAAIRSGRLPKCLAHYFEQLLKSQDFHGASVGPVTTKQGSPPAPGMTGSFGLRFTATITLHGIQVPFYVDILGFADGPAEVSLDTFGIPRPFPGTVEERLFSLLVERARAHML
jgi:hypothetical protein